MCYLMSMLKRLRRLCFGFTIVITRRVAKVILSLSMILILLMCWTVAPLSYSRALITELTLVGGGDLTLSALLDLLMVAFGAAGMDGAVRNQAAATGTQPVPYVGQLLNRYLEIALDSMLPAVWGQRISNGLSILANGTLYLDSDATAAVADFQRWAWDSEGADLVSYAVEGTANAGDWINGNYHIYRSVNSNYYQYVNPVRPSAKRDLYYGLSFGQTASGLYYAGTTDLPSVTYILVYESNNRYYYYGWLAGNDLMQQYVVVFHSSDGSYSQHIAGGSSALHQWVALYQGLPSQGFTNELELSQYDGTLPADPTEGMETTAVIGDVDTFVGPMQQEQGTQLPLGDFVTVSSDTAATMHLLNYLRAVAAAYAGTGTAQVPVTDVGTGEDELLPLSVPLDTPIGVTGVTDTAIDQSGAVAGTDAVAGDFAGTDDFTMDLTQFFPFCIPFDIYALYAKFEAEAQAPVIDWPIPIPGQEQPFTIHLDFSVFDSLAVWVRRLELIAFAVGLMFLTKHLIQGGD